MKLRTLKLGKLFIGMSIARKGTVWIHRSKHSRTDDLIAITRTYMRKDRVYLYTFNFGRLSIKGIWL